MAAIAHSHQPLALSHVANALCTPTDRSVGRGALVYYAIRIRYTENWNHQRFVEPRATEQRGKLSTEAGTTTAQWQHSPIVGVCHSLEEETGHANVCSLVHRSRVPRVVAGRGVSPDPHHRPHGGR